MSEGRVGRSYILEMARASTVWAGEAASEFVQADLYDVMEGVTLVLDCHGGSMRLIYVPRGYIHWSYML